MKKMLQQTRDLRQFPMTPEQYKQFSKLAKKQKLLYSAIHDRDGKGKLVDVILPVTELDRANLIFERIALTAPEKSQGKPKEEAMPSKKDSPSGRDSPATKQKLSSARDSRTTMTTNEKPSIEGRLKAYQEQLDRGKSAVPAKEQTKSRPKER